MRTIGFLECLEPARELWLIRLPIGGDDHCEGRPEDYEYSRHNGGRRHHRRFAISGKSFVSKAGAADGAWLKVGEISLHGCQLQGNEPLKLGNRLTLVIHVAHTQIEASGVVRFSDSSSGTEVEFTYMSSANRRKLTHLVAQLERADAVMLSGVGLANGRERA